MRIRHVLPFALALVPLAATGCESTPRLPATASGDEMYGQLSCAECHGADGAGIARKGPPLRQLREHWGGEENLAEFLLDPRPFRAGNPRVMWMYHNYSFVMPGYPGLTRDQRIVLARWLFTLE